MAELFAGASSGEKDAVTAATRPPEQLLIQRGRSSLLPLSSPQPVFSDGFHHALNKTPTAYQRLRLGRSPQGLDDSLSSRHTLVGHIQQDSLTPRMGESYIQRAGLGGGWVSRMFDDGSKEALAGLAPSASGLVLGVESGVVAAFVASFLMIVMSELGDKTFFIAALMSMKYSPLTVFCGAIGALTLMTFLSAAVGSALPKLLHRRYTHIASVILFFFFGIKLIYQALSTGGDADQAELLEVEADLNRRHSEDGSSPLEKRGSEGRLATAVMISDPSPSFSTTTSRQHALTSVPILSRGAKAFWARVRVAASLIGPIFIQAFSLTFLAEWGDRSQIATIALAAARDVWAVSFGAVLGHALCTGIAVLGGKMLAASISEKAVTLVGGILFVAFGILGISFDI